MGALVEERRSELLAGLRLVSAEWRELTGARPDSMIRWCPVAVLEGARLCVGLSFDGWWTTGSERSAREFRSESDAMFFLPILELAPGNVRRQIAEGLSRLGLSSEFVQLFPFEDVMVVGLKSASEHWVSLALKWAEVEKNSPRIRAALVFAAKTGPTQSIRHAARRLLKSPKAAD